MLKHAKDTWNLLRPGPRTSFWLAAKVNSLGCADLTCAFHKVAKALKRAGKIPAAFDPNGEITVRKALCPSHETAAQVQGDKAWCKKGNKVCHFLGKTGDNWAECEALDLREGQEYWWDLGKQKKEAPKKSLLSNLAKLLGVGALAGLSAWKAHEKSIERQRRPSEGKSDAYIIITSALKAHRLTYSYDTQTQTFKLPNASIRMLPSGGAEMVNRGKKSLAYKNNLLDKVFDFLKGVRR